MFNWFRASYWPVSIMRINCSILLMMAVIAFTLQDAKGQTPATYTWQIERMQQGSNGAVIQVLRPNDVVSTFQDVPLFLFPRERAAAP